MNCQCQGIEELFSDKMVSKELDRYHRKGPDGTTRMLIQAIKAHDVQGQTLLDVGGGLGAIQHALLEAGASSATDIDASQAYILAAREEARRRGLAGKIRFEHGNFVDLAAEVPPADIVTLDRVLCCYDDAYALVERSAERAKRLYGLVYPRDTWWARIGMGVLNIFMRLQGNPYRAFVHPTEKVEELIQRHGLRRSYYRRTFIWQVVVYARA